jgi:hypothetical protein
VAENINMKQSQTAAALKGPELNPDFGAQCAQGLPPGEKNNKQQKTTQTTSSGKSRHHGIEEGSMNPP